MSVYDPKKITKFTALKNYVVVTDMNFKEKISHGGIIIPHSDGKLEGVHARWGKVYAVGPAQQDVRPGQYVLVKHGRWTRGVLIEDQEGEKTIRRIDDADILMVSDEPMQDETIGRGL
jgi:co-chaperonin GroES (HSP10)